MLYFNLKIKVPKHTIAHVIYIKGIYVAIFLAIYIKNNLFWIIINIEKKKINGFGIWFSSSDLVALPTIEQNHSEAKANLIIYAINNIKNDCAIELVKNN